MVSEAFKGIPPLSTSVGEWLPKDRAHIKQWLATKLEQLEKRASIPLDPSIIAMKDLVGASSSLTQLSQEMFTQIPPSYVNDPTGEPQVRDFHKMLELVNLILQEGPQWFDVPDQTAMGMIGFPLTAILEWPMSTLAGHKFFLDPQVNVKLQGILKIWGTFLATPNSLPCLNRENGWLSDGAQELLAAKGNNGETHYTFAQLYACDPNAANYGFTSWDAFFTRRFNPGIRPVDYPDDQPCSMQPDPTQIIVNACESTPLQIVTNVRLNDFFWLKQQPYSLANMLNNDPLASHFAGGSVYQAYLSALSYHCWHAPVSGTVVSTQTVPGTYYSENLYQGFIGPNGPDPLAPNNSQPYISAVATRTIMFIQADNLTVGLMAIVFIGMAEVSSCELLVKENDRITKGDLIGMFHFGGSSHCMVFRPDTNMQPHNFVTGSRPPWTDVEHNLPVCSALAMANSHPRHRSSTSARQSQG